MTVVATIDSETRRALLEREIANYLKQGYRVISQSETAAQLVKPKRFSKLWFAVWWLAVGVGPIIYVVYYLAKKDATVYLSVDATGSIERR